MTADIAALAATWDQSFPAGWHHVVAVREKNQLQLYVDGKLVAQSHATIAEPLELTSAAPLQIGFGAQQHFDGGLSDVRITRGVHRP